MKILFVNISKNWNGRVYPEYPIGIGILATMAKRAGHDVKIYDMAVSNELLTNVVRDFLPDVTALSFLSTSATTASAVINSLNDEPCGYLIAGGIHASIFPVEVVNMGVDFVLKGEGELNFIPLIQLLSATPYKSDNYHKQIKKIPNLVFKDDAGVFQHTAPPTESVDLTTSGWIDRDLFELNLYPHHTIMTSRGCPYKCKFCCSWGPGGKRGRMASPERIIAELEYLVTRYGSITVYWADDMFFFNKRDRIRFCEMIIERQLPVKWIAQLRADSIDSELAEILAMAGCEKICIGAESGSDRVLEQINKRTKVSDIKNAIRIAKEAGMRVKTWWITGLPGSTLIEEYSALDAIQESMPNEVAIHTFVPLPGTEYWDKADEYGITKPSMDELEKLFYYGKPGEIQLDYITKDELTDVILAFNDKLKQLGYVPTDLANPGAEYVYTSPLQDKTFVI